MLNSINKITIGFFVSFLLLGFCIPAFAVNHNQGSYGSSIYSATIPTAIATPVSGTYTSAQIVSLSATGSTQIRYSFIGLPADCSSDTLYTTPISVANTNTIYVRACDGLNNSSTATFQYIISLNNKTYGSYLPGYGVNKVIPTKETKYVFKKYLKLNMIDEEVRELQKYLNKNGYVVSEKGVGSIGQETNKFGLLTKKALIKFQLANNIKPASGIFGPITRAKIKSLNLQ